MRMRHCWLAACTVSICKLRFSPEGQSPRGLVILMSGAGGWLPFVNQIGKEFAAAGFDVFGFDSLRYFFNRQRSPLELASDLEAAVETWRNGAAPRNIILAGYSQGADVIPFVVNRFSPKLRSEIKLAALIGIAKQADFKIGFLDFLTGGYSANALGTSQEIQGMRDIPILCVFGEKDRDTLCHELSGDGIECRKIRGGHFFLWNGREVARILLEKTVRVLDDQGRKS